jgi:hypothetical protein
MRATPRTSLHPVLLLSRDAELAARIRRALPGGLPLELHCADTYTPALDPRGWLLILVDEQLELGGAAAGDAPVLWLGTGPLLAVPDRDALPGPIVDYMDRNQASSKLAFILHQHLTGAYLRRLRLPPTSAPAPAPEQLRAQINNALTGILGNAELAAELAANAGRKLPEPLGQRLERILELALQMRELLMAAQWHASPS